MALGLDHGNWLGLTYCFHPYRRTYPTPSTMTKKSDHTVLFDFTGTDPQADYSINFALSQDMLKMFIVSYMLLVYVS